MNKAYYAIIPANVRYDKDLTPNAKLMYGEITALCNEKGYCWASNNYFAKLYGTSTTTVSRWIKSLKDRGHITTEIIYKEGTKEIANRYIQICGEGINKNDNTPINKNVKENNTSINNTFNNTYYINQDLNDLFIDFLQMRKKLKAVNSERAINSLLKTLSNYDDDTKYKMIENSITNSWKGIFPLKEQKTFKPQRVEKVPEWINTNIDESEASEEEQKAIDDLFNSEEPFEERKAKLQARLKQKYGRGGQA
jgi:hypothetical protein